jgi:hypothetical protein
VVRQARLVLEERAATWTGRDIERAVAMALRETGWRIDETAIAALAEGVRADPASVSLTPDRPVEAGLSVAGRDDVFGRAGEDRWTSSRVLDGEAYLQQLAATEPARAASGDGPVRAALDGAEARIATLEATKVHAGDEAAAAGREADRLDVERDQIAVARPAYGAVSAELAGENGAAGQVAAIDTRLASRGLSGPRGVERARLEAQRAELMAAWPGLADTAESRRRRGEARLAAAERADRTQVSALAERAATVRATAAAATGRARWCELELAAARAGLDELYAAAVPDQLDILAGLAGDQRHAAIRLADPARPLDALVGPAGAGKTTTLAATARLVEAQGRQVTGLAPPPRRRCSARTWASGPTRWTRPCWIGGPAGTCPRRAAW